MFATAPVAAQPPITAPGVAEERADRSVAFGIAELELKAPTAPGVAAERADTSVACDIAELEFSPAPVSCGPLLGCEAPCPSQPFRCHVAAYCTQHKTGNAVEQISKFLGVLSPSFCLASCLANGEVSDSLHAAICKLIDDNWASSTRPICPSTITTVANSSSNLHSWRRATSKTLGQIATGNSPYAWISDGMRPKNSWTFSSYHGPAAKGFITLALRVVVAHCLQQTKRSRVEGRKSSQNSLYAAYYGTSRQQIHQDGPMCSQCGHDHLDLRVVPESHRAQAWERGR